MRARCEAGVSLLELVVAAVILAVLLAAALPYLTPRPMHLRADTNDFVANLRLARDLAISRTTHYRVRVLDNTSYAIEKGTWTGNGWTFSQERVVSLRPGVEFPATGMQAEFDSRGRLSGGGGNPPPQFVLKDASSGDTRTVVVGSAGGIWEQ